MASEFYYLYILGISLFVFVAIFTAVYFFSKNKNGYFKQLWAIVNEFFSHWRS